MSVNKKQAKRTKTETAAPAVADEADAAPQPSTAGGTDQAAPQPEQAGETEQGPAPKPKKSRPRSRKSGFFTGWRGLTLWVFLVALAGLGVYMTLDFHAAWVAKEQALAARVDALEGADQSLRQENEALRARLAAADAQLANMADSFSRLARQSDSGWGWRLTEIRHLLAAASHRLALERDVDTALAALQMAAARLGEIPDPKLAGVRGQLAVDLARLQEAAQGPSLAGLAQSLSDLAREAAALPLRPVRPAVATPGPAEAEGPETASWWRRALRALLQELKSLVVISRSGASVALLPKEAYFLRQNLRLQLEAARLALLLKDSQQFQASLRVCQDWLREHFDLGDPDARAALAMVEAAAAADLERAVPSVSRSLQALENYLSERNANSGE